MVACTATPCSCSSLLNTQSRTVILLPFGLQQVLKLSTHQSRRSDNLFAHPIHSSSLLTQNNMRLSSCAVSILLALQVVASHSQLLKDPCRDTEPQALDAATGPSVIKDAFEGLTELKVIQANVSSPL